MNHKKTRAAAVALGLVVLAAPRPAAAGDVEVAVEGGPPARPATTSAFRATGARWSS